MTTVTFSQDPGVTATFDISDGNDPIVLTEIWDRNDYHLLTSAVAGGTVVDLGANIGAFTVLAAKLGAAVVHAYEPHPDNRVCLEANVAANGVTGRVVVHDQAVTDKPGKVWLAGAGCGARTVGGDDSGLRVEAVGLNQILAELEEVAFLKIDVEGAEYQILDGVDIDLLRRVAMIAGEFHNRPRHPRHVTRWGKMMAKLADYGRLETVGHPTMGGLFWAARY